MDGRLTGIRYDPSARPRTEMVRLRVFTRFRDSVHGGQLLPPFARLVILGLGAATFGAALALAVPMRFPDAVVPSEHELDVLVDLHRTRALRPETGVRQSRSYGGNHR